MNDAVAKVGSKGRKVKPWSDRELEVLKIVFPKFDIPREEILKLFPDRTWGAIDMKAREGLHLSREMAAGKVDEEAFKKMQKVYGI